MVHTKSQYITTDLFGDLTQCDIAILENGIVQNIWENIMDEVGIFDMKTGKIEFNLCHIKPTDSAKDLDIKYHHILEKCKLQGLQYFELTMEIK